MDEAIGFKGYHIAVFSKFLLIEHPQVGNAVYIVDFKDPIQVNEEIFEKPAFERVDDEFADRTIRTQCIPIFKEAKTKSQLREKFGAVKIVHTQDTWQNRLQTAINERV